MNIADRITQLQTELTLLNQIQTTAAQPFDWNSAPLISILDNQEYYLGPESTTEMSYDDAVTWATNIGGTIPNRFILLKLLENANLIAADYLWSSTEVDPKTVWVQNMNTLTQNAYNKNSLYSVRAIQIKPH